MLSLTTLIFGSLPLVCLLSTELPRPLFCGRGNGVRARGEGPQGLGSFLLLHRLSYHLEPCISLHSSLQRSKPSRYFHLQPCAKNLFCRQRRITSHHNTEFQFLIRCAAID